MRHPIRGQCCDCGLYFEPYTRTGSRLARWLICERCGTQHLLRFPNPDNPHYSLWVFATGPLIRAIAPEMLAELYREQAERKKEEAERLLEMSYSPEQQQKRQQEREADARQKDRIAQVKILLMLPVFIILFPLILILWPLAYYLTEVKRSSSENTAEERANWERTITDYRLVREVSPEATGEDGSLANPLDWVIKHGACGHCNHTGALTCSWQLLTCPKCGGKQVVVLTNDGISK